MSIQDTAMIVGTVCLGLVMVLQALLALGLPLGRFAWGGRYRVLPWKLRWASFSAVFVLGFAAWMLLVRAGTAGLGPQSPFPRVVVWIFAGYFTLNVAMNAGSKSRTERMMMTPVSVILAACFFVVAAGL